MAGGNIFTTRVQNLRMLDHFFFSDHEPSITVNKMEQIPVHIYAISTNGGFL